MKYNCNQIEEKKYSQSHALQTGLQTCAVLDVLLIILRGAQGGYEYRNPAQKIRKYRNPARQNGQSRNPAWKIRKYRSPHEKFE